MRAIFVWIQMMPEETGRRDIAPSVLSERTQAVTVSAPSLPRFLGAVIRNPLDALPAESYRDPIVLARLAGRSRLYPTDTAMIHEVYVRQADHLEKGPIFRRVLGAALGDGILTADSEHWRAQRAAAAPAFGHARLLGFLPAMLSAAEAARDRWLAAGPNVVFDLGHEMMVATFAIVADIMLSGSDAMDVGRVERAIATYLGSAGGSPPPQSSACRPGCPFRVAAGRWPLRRPRRIRGPEP